MAEVVKTTKSFKSKLRDRPKHSRELKVFLLILPTFQPAVLSFFPQFFFLSISSFFGWMSVCVSVFLACRWSLSWLLDMMRRECDCVPTTKEILFEISFPFFFHFVFSFCFQSTAAPISPSAVSYSFQMVSFPSAQSTIRCQST